MDRRRNKDRWTAAYLNNRIYDYYITRLTELALSRFEWEGLPESMDGRFLEYTLMTDGVSVLFEDEVMGPLNMQVMLDGRLNQYRIPVTRRAYAVNGYSKELDESNSVLIYNNMLRTNSINTLQTFAYKLWEIDRTMQVNTNAQKTPVVIICDENQRLTMKNLYAQYEGNEPFIFGSNNLDLKGMQVLETGAPYVVDKLRQEKTEVWNEAMTYLGISNLVVNKRERVVSDEVQRGMGSTIASRYSALQMRQTACEQFNKMFGYNISVRYREDSQIGEDDSQTGNQPVNEFEGVEIDE